MLPRHHPDRIRIAFDDHRLVNNAGLILPATLALHLGPAPPRYSPGCSELCPGTDGPVIPRANPRLTEVRRRV